MRLPLTVTGREPGVYRATLVPYVLSRGLLILLTLGLSLAERVSPLTLWDRWDTKWYVGIALHGYHWSLDGKPAIAFFPLYPLLLHITQPIVSPLAAGMVLSNVAFVGALFYLYRWVREEWGTQAAERSIWLVCFFPTAFFTFATYTEALFLLCVAGTLYHAHRREFGPAGWWLAIALLTRSTGVALLPAVGVVLWRRPIADWMRGLVPGALALSGYAWYLATEHIPWEGVLGAQRFWHRSAALPWIGFVASVQWLTSHVHPNPAQAAEDLIQLGITSVCLALTAWAGKRLTPIGAAYCLGCWILWLTSVEWMGHYYAPFSSMDRFVVALLPLAAWLGFRLNNRQFRVLLVACAVTLVGAATVHMLGGWVG